MEDFIPSFGVYLQGLSSLGNGHEGSERMRSCSPLGDFAPALERLRRRPPSPAMGASLEEQQRWMEEYYSDLMRQFTGDPGSPLCE